MVQSEPPGGTFEQVEELAHTLTRQVAWSLTPLMDNSDDNQQKSSTRSTS